MRKSGALVWVFCVALAFTLLAVTQSWAAWRIDPARFHISAHGELSCLECHANKAKAAPHPDPQGVNRTLKQVFKTEHCTSCHSVEEGIKAGKHGTLKVDDPKRFANCITCHNPHYQARISTADRAKYTQDQPKTAQCGACHKFRKELPKPAEEAQKCVSCHLAGGGLKPTAAQKTAICASCHSSKNPAPHAKSLDWAILAKGPHKQLDCFSCHPAAARYPHNRQPGADCLSCHHQHEEKPTGDAHLSVSCQACHLQGVKPLRKGDRVVAASLAPAGKASEVHKLANAASDATCTRCHAPGNKVGAAAMVLPAKSMMCMPCHTATFSLGDTTSIIALAIFAIGLVGAFSFWFSGGIASAAGGGKASALFSQVFGALFSLKIIRILKAFILDGLLQRRLWKISPWRGLIHNMIFLPFLFRFTWGLIALLASIHNPRADWVWAMIDKNNPVTAFLFDFSGLMVLAGVAAAVGRRFLARPTKPRPAGLPKPDFLAMGLLLAIVLVGFFLEGMRIAMTGAPAGAGYAFLGYLLSGLFTPGATGSYGYLWYAHAILTGAFVAYLPFSRMFHMILAPIVIAAGAAEEHEDH